MNIGILGAGTVGTELATGFRDRGDSVCIATRDPAKLAEWQLGDGRGIRVGSAVEAAEFGEIVFLAVAWAGAEAVIRMAGLPNLSGKVLVDVTNPLVFDQEGAPPKLAFGYPESAGKRIQKLVPDARVVKCFNIVNARLMAHPNEATQTPDMFLAGDDDGAKAAVSDIATGWGWKCHDLGGIDQSYLLEAFAMIWITYGFQTNTWTHVFKLMNTGDE